FENIIDLGIPKTSDSVEVLAITNDAPEFFPLGETTVTWTVSDTSGNTNTAAQIVSVVDTTAPIITIPENIIKEADSLNTTKFSIGDAVANDLNKVESITNDAPEFFPLGETIVTWTATDGAGNTSTATQKITIVDTTKPEISKPSDITQEAISKLENTVTLETPLASDNVRIESITNDAPEFFPLGETIVTWTATDGAGNLESISQKIIIQDTISPKFAKISDVVVEATSKDSNSISLQPPVVTDISDIKSLINDAPEKFSLGETMVIWTAADDAGNESFISQKVTVIDTSSPVLTIPDDVVTDLISIRTPVIVGLATATDLTDDHPKITNDAPDTFPIGQTTVTWIAQDKFGNSMNKTQIVTIQACGKPESTYNLIIGTEDDDTLVGTNL
ncbi:MAG: HYR domain-containing protein, partial [Candidatus Nitrosotenuis sp.]